MPPFRPLVERFLEKFDVDENGCWLWTAALDAHGYSRIQVGNRNEAGHRVAHELFTGPIPEGLTIDHLCRVRRCVNPDHLEAVTLAENIRRRGLAITHCIHGHEYTPENTVLSYRPDRRFPRRACRICMNAAQRRCQAKKRQAGLL